MDEELVGFPEEADNTQFQAVPIMPVAELREKFREFVDLEAISEMTGEEFSFVIESDSFKGIIRVFLTNDHVTNAKEGSPELFFISGPAVMLNIEGEELDVSLEVGGQIDFFGGSTDVLLGTLTVWRMQIDPEIGLLDAS